MLSSKSNAEAIMDTQFQKMAIPSTSQYGPGDEDPSEIKKRSVVIAGHRTSISLENLFWDTLRQSAEIRGKSVNQLVTEIDRERSGNLSSAIRTFVLIEALQRR